MNRAVIAKCFRDSGPVFAMRKHVAPSGCHSPIGDIQADLPVAQRTQRTVYFYRVSHDLTVRNKTASPANNASDIAATEY